MPITTITFANAINSSLQTGDLVYYSPTTNVANPNINSASTSTMVKFGVVNSIILEPPSINVFYDDDPGNTGTATVFPPAMNDYIMFEKDKQVNSSSLIGYYADVKLLNDSKERAELFTLGTQVSESSK